jgi:hypothetical protein
MRKFLMVLAVAIMTLAFVGPEIASAAGADIKMIGIMRWRGVTLDDADGNSDVHDSEAFADSLVRMRWTARSEGGKVWGLYETDFSSGNGVIGNNGGRRRDVGVNRWLVDFAIPGSTLRARFGKTDWTAPGSSRDIIGGSGRNRIEGYGIYGKLFGPVSMSLWTTKTNEGFEEFTDIDSYYLSVTWKAAPAISITPWFYWYHDKDGNCAGEGADPGDPNFGVCGTESATWDIKYYALQSSMKFGIASIDLTGIISDGEQDFSRGSGLSDIDQEGWAILTRFWFSFGKLKVGVYTHHFSGDDDSDGTNDRFVGPRLNGASRLDGPQLITGRRYSTIGVFTARRNRQGGGNGGAGMNGAHIFELLGKYQITKSLEVMGNISYIQSDKRRVNTSGGCNGVSCPDTNFDSSKDVGVELDASIKYSIYKSLWARLTGAYLFAGDYGRNKTLGNNIDDTWAIYSEIRHTFKQ